MNQRIKKYQRMLKLSNDELEVENLINKEVNDLKIENLNLNIGNDLSGLEEIYIDEPEIEIRKYRTDINLNTNTDDENKIKTVFIDTDEKIFKVKK